MSSETSPEIPAPRADARHEGPDERPEPRAPRRRALTWGAGALTFSVLTLGGFALSVPATTGGTAPATDAGPGTSATGPDGGTGTVVGA